MQALIYIATGCSINILIIILLKFSWQYLNFLNLGVPFMKVISIGNGQKRYRTIITIKPK
jgi:hypothetical protein